MLAIVAKPHILHLVICFMIIINLAYGQVGLNCCTQDYAIDGINCVSPTQYNNLTYYCMETTSLCGSCQLSTTVSQDQCSQCCVTEDEICTVDYANIGTYFSAWTLVLIIFALSCFCCALVFLTAEQSRMKEGMSFQEAYLLPIPLVTAETDLENRNYNIPFDQPTAIAKPHISIDIPVAEPTEFAPLLNRSNRYDI